MHKKELVLSSIHLERKVKITLILPPRYALSFHHYPVLYLNDGQDLPSLRMEESLHQLYSAHEIPHFILVGIHANEQRKHEYGTAKILDYAGRGSKAGKHTHFVLTELKPYIEQHYRANSTPEYNYFAGFSLGGLSALDIVWHHPHVFSKVGVFSGSFWWRSKALDQGYNEATDRIMHALIRENDQKPAVKFWLQTGTEDEVSDRNNNGIIDSIDDTLGLIEELEKKGYQRDEEIVYREVEGGRHDQTTWGRVFPEFLIWVFK
ncbi:alpha/beta hydrolase [Haliscomenobacter hydrossis]|uniref:Esterase n=1 Tax=Haliscomenobacter hydrossis (strain ATCC 27775 / DSM 1100 / LMG 10767 / O) TaxID=760192 RepID=F4KX12_HALH1|nr:alpha/beta hydrolase-fold protein [Haliscomenobacter hydrossis]AEE53612.1 esterase [Haliscomenobacter hydrossis DSM 1100]